MQRETFLYKKVTEYLSRLIADHYGEDDYKLPTEAEIIAQVGVSRITVRKAYAILEENNLIVRSKRAGTKINNALPREQVLSLLNVTGYPTELTANKTVAVILPLITGEGYHVTSILSAIVNNHENNTVIIDCSSMSAEKEQALIDKYIDMKVDGIILYPVDNEIYNPTLLKLSMMKFPLILIDRILPGLSLPYVSSDHENMVKLAVNHLLEKQHKYILYFNANVKTNSSLSIRKDSFINSLYDAHNYRPYFYSFEGDADPTSLSFCEDFREFLDTNTKISAIVAADYSSGMHLTKMLNTLGEPYSQRFEVVYLDFHPMQFKTVYSDSHPTYIMQNSYAIGEEAIKMMQNAFEGMDTANSKVIVPVSIVKGNLLK